jgi:hypothetical protein
VVCAELAPVCSAQHDARSALPFTMGEQQAQQRLRYYLGLEESDGHMLRAAGQPPPIAGYGQSRMQVRGGRWGAWLMGGWVAVKPMWVAGWLSAWLAG